MKKSLLVQGRIPANTECPFKSQCNFAVSEDQTSRCKHTGKDHPVPFSCGAARFFDLDQSEK